MTGYELIASIAVSLTQLAWPIAFVVVVRVLWPVILLGCQWFSTSKYVGPLSMQIDELDDQEEPEPKKPNHLRTVPRTPDKS